MRMARGVAVVREDQKRQGNARILHCSCPVRMLAHQPTVSHVTSVYDVLVHHVPDSNRCLRYLFFFLLTTSPTPKRTKGIGGFGLDWTAKKTGHCATCCVDIYTVTLVFKDTFDCDPLLYTLHPARLCGMAGPYGE